MSNLQYSPRKHLILIALAACLAFLAACGGLPATPVVPASPAPVRDYWPTDGWRSDAPANRGLDEAALAGLRAQIEQEMPFLDSLLIVKDGYLVYEEYFNGYDADRLHQVASVTKSFTSALYGMAQAALLWRALAPGSSPCGSTARRKRRRSISRMEAKSSGSPWAPRPRILKRR